MGLATDAINRLGLSPEETKKLLDAMPVAYAVTYIFGTVGSAIVLALIGPALLGIDLEAACKRYEEKHGGKKEAGRSRHGLAPTSSCARSASERGLGSSARRRKKPRRCFPSSGCSSSVIRRGGQDHRCDRRHRDSGGGRRGSSRSARGAGQRDRCRRRRSRRSRVVGGAGRRRRCLRDQQGGRRKDTGRVGDISRSARRVPAKDHPRSDRDRHPDSAEHAAATGRYRHPRRSHAGHNGSDQDVGLSGPRDRRGRCGVHWRGNRDRRAARRDRLQGRQRAPHACPPPAAL